MTDLARSRIIFIDQLHAAFLSEKGHGAFAFMNITDALLVFEDYLDSGEPIELFCGRLACAA
jgi:hypothetical protein